MIIASINLNKRAGNPDVRHRLLHWLNEHDCALLLCQEPWSRACSIPVDLPGFHSIGGTSSVFAWVRDDRCVREFSLPNPEWLVLQVGYIRIHNVYLSAYSGRKRIDMYKALFQDVQKNSDEPTIIVGDFNTAPNPRDGLYAGALSAWTSEGERGELKSFIEAGRLVDMTSEDRIGVQEYTIERVNKGAESSFRCDLALVSDYLASDVKVLYDHSVRDRSSGITDHSAVLLDVPVTADLPNTLPFIDLPECYAPHKTAMARKDASTIAKKLIEKGICQRLGIESVLDFGCGRGQDVRFYTSRGLRADGYDPHPAFGWVKRPSERYDLVTVVFVANVLPAPQERIAALRDACQYIRSGGYLLVAARAPEAIEREAKAKGWLQHNDGYWSHAAKRTFQKGISRVELLAILRRLGVDEAGVEVGLDRDVTTVLGRLSARSRPDGL